MAKGSAIIGKIKGHAGNLVFQVRKGEQIIKTKPGPRSKDHLPTYNQAWNYMRFKWASLMSQVTLELTDHSFTRRKITETSTNKCVSANTANFNPINKKCKDRYDLSVEAPLTFNGIQMSTGTMAPVEITYSTNINGGDFAIGGDAAGTGTLLSINWINNENDSVKANTNWNALMNDAKVLQTAAKAAQARGLNPGEMLTMVFMTAEGYGSFSPWAEEVDLPYGLEMIFVRFKLDADGKTFIIEPSQSFMNVTEGIAPRDEEMQLDINIGNRWVVGACIIHSREIYGGWECDDTFMRMLDPNTHTWIKNFTWEQNARTLYSNEWSTQQMPILDPASLTEIDQPTTFTGRVITTRLGNGNVSYKTQLGDDEEVIIEGENLDVKRKKKGTKKSEAESEE